MLNSANFEVAHAADVERQAVVLQETAPDAEAYLHEHVDYLWRSLALAARLAASLAEGAPRELERGPLRQAVAASMAQALGNRNVRAALTGAGIVQEQVAALVDAGHFGAALGELDKVTKGPESGPYRSSLAMLLGSPPEKAPGESVEERRGTHDDGSPGHGEPTTCVKAESDGPTSGAYWTRMSDAARYAGDSRHRGGIQTSKRRARGT